MKTKKYLRAKILVIFALFLFFPCILWAKEAYVRWVIDGDTVVLSRGEKLRLKAIDAPELGHEGKKEQYFARESKYFLFKMLKGKKVRLKEISRDRFKRLLAQVYLPSGKWVNKTLVALGYAFYFEHKGEAYPELLQAQREAMQARRGFWAKLLSLPLASKTYLGNNSSKRFHLLKCPEAAKISSWHKRLFFSLYEAFYNGYAPARDCTPWPTIN